MSFFSPDQPQLEARARRLTCPRCGESLRGSYVSFRRTRVEVFCACGQMTCFTPDGLRGDVWVDNTLYGDDFAAGRSDRRP